MGRQFGPNSRQTDRLVSLHMRSRDHPDNFAGVSAGRRSIKAIGSEGEFQFACAVLNMRIVTFALASAVRPQRNLGHSASLYGDVGAIP